MNRLEDSQYRSPDVVLRLNQMMFEQIWLEVCLIISIICFDLCFLSNKLIFFKTNDKLVDPFFVQVL